MSLALFISTLDGSVEPFTMEVNTRVGDMKKQLEERGFSSSLFNLLYEGVVMEDSKLVSGYGVNDNDQITMEESEKAIALRRLGDKEPTSANLVAEVKAGGDLVISYIHAGVEPDDFDTRIHLTPLAMAVKEGRHEIIKQLLAHGSNPNQQVYYSGIPLTIASSGGDEVALKILIEGGADVNGMNIEGYSPLLIASQASSVGVVKELLRSGAKPDYGGSVPCTPLVAASKLGYVSILEELIKAGADVNYVVQKVTALQVAATNGRLEAVEMLIENGAIVDFLNDEGRSALLFAVENGFIEVVELLLKKSAKVNQIDNSGNSALCIASKYNHSKIVELLISYKADVNNTLGNHQPILIAKEESHEELVEILKANGAVLN